tara:strand:- start:30 stop:1340 length:1311 start_codon:yes stop_codon:yes gene_type:complete
MAKKIFEELPARKHSPAAAPAAQGGEKKEGGEGGSEKKIRQAVYDIRYRARREGIDLRAAYSQYMQNSNLTAPEQAAVRAKLFGKDGGGDKKESYNALMSDGASDTVATALFKVFVEGQEQVNAYEQQLEEGAERKYKVRVTDEKTGRSYVRYADRAKITELRQKGLKVEMTEHGEPYEGEKKKKGRMDPVAKNPKDRDGDVNNDGKKDGTDKYIYARRDAINAAIAKRKGMKEEFLVDGTTSTEGQGTMVPDGKVNNYAGKKPVVTINPESQADGHGMNRARGLRLAHTELEGEVIAEKAVSKSQQRFMGMVCAYKKGEMENASDEVVEAAKSMSKKDACDFAGTKHDELPEKVAEEKEESCPKCKKCPCECGYMDREKRTYRELLKNKLRAMGMKNPMMLGAPDDGEKVMKIMTSSSAKMTSEGYGKKPKKKKK